MNLESIDVIDQPVDIVYQTVRDDLPNLAPYLPNIDKIICESKAKSKSGLNLRNRWYAKVELPMLLKKFIKPELLSWLDHASWDDQSKTVSFSLESPLGFGKSLFEAKGINYFESKGQSKTTLRVTCEVKLYPENVPGVPKILAKKLEPAIESLIKKMLEPNLVSLAKGLKSYYEARN